MNQILPLLAQLDDLYRADNLDTYEQCWQIVCQKIECFFPGFSLAYAEIYTAGSSRTADGRMTHVLVPMKGMQAHETIQNY